MGGLDPNIIRPIAVCSVFLFAVIGAIVMALLDHQRKMAEIIRSNMKQSEGLDERVDALQTDIRELKSMLASRTTSSEADELRQRL
jgi:hypothetical protein